MRDFDGSISKFAWSTELLKLNAPVLIFVAITTKDISPFARLKGKQELHWRGIISGDLSHVMIIVCVIQLIETFHFNKCRAKN